MKNLKLTIIKDILKKDYKWLSRDFKSGEQVYLYTGSTHGCISKNGLACTLDEGDSFFELPTTVLGLKYEDKEFGIFMTEQNLGYQLFYCKELPIDHMDLLTKTQSNVHLIDSKKSKPDYKTENQILKVKIKNGKIEYELSQLEDVVPLF
jgi:hypothetical protein